MATRMWIFLTRYCRTLGRIEYPMCMIVGSSGPEKVLPQKNEVSSDYVSTAEKEDRPVRHMAEVHRNASAAEIRATVGITVTHRTITNWILEGKLRSRQSAGPVCRDRRLVDYRCSPGHLLTHTCQSLAPRCSPLSPETTTDIHSVLQ